MLIRSRATGGLHNLSFRRDVTIRMVTGRMRVLFFLFRMFLVAHSLVCLQEWTTCNARNCSRTFEANPPPAANPTPADRGDRTTPTRRQVGDWTQELFRLGLGKPRLPLWITAAQPSLMEKSIYYNNVVLVCTGAGITPAVSIIERFAKRKNIHLMWMTRDRGMVRSNRCLLGRVSGRRRSSA